MKSLAQNTFFNILYRIMNLIFPLITSMYVARVLLDSGIGKVAYVQNIASYFISLSSSGMSDYGLREIAKVRNDKKKLNQLFTQLFLINTVLTLLSIAGYIFVFIVMKYENIGLAFVCGIPVFLNLLNVDWFYRGNEEYKYIVYRSLVIKIISFVAIFSFVKNESDYVIYALISSLAVCGNYLFNVVHLFRKYVKFDLEDMKIKVHIRPLAVITAGAFLAGIYSKSDITMLGMMDSNEAVGLYSYAHKTVEIILTICISLTGAFLPRLSYYYKNNYKRMLELVEFGVKLLAFITIPACIGMILISDSLVCVLYGEAFVVAASTVKIFSFLIIIKGFGDLICYQLGLCTGNEAKRLPACIMAAIANIILNACFIPVWSIEGAAVASVVSELIVNAYQFFAIRKEIPIKIHINTFVQAVTSSIVMGIVVRIILQLDLLQIQGCVCSVLFGVTVYITVNYIMKNEILLFFIEKIKNLAKRKKEH